MKLPVSIHIVREYLENVAMTTKERLDRAITVLSEMEELMTAEERKVYGGVDVHWRDFMGDLLFGLADELEESET